MSAAYPEAPWRLHGSMWLTLWWHRRSMWGTALVDYTDPSPLTYHELLVARPVHAPRPRRPLEVEITDIWVDSESSRLGGRELWAIPKGLGDFSLEESTGRRRGRARWQAPGVRADFTDVSALAPRAPYGARTVQPALAESRGDDDPVVTPFRGTGRVAPCRARWDIDADGPLAFLRGARRLGSVRVTDFDLSFG